MRQPFVNTVSLYFEHYIIMFFLISHRLSVDKCYKLLHIYFLIDFSGRNAIIKLQ